MAATVIKGSQAGAVIQFSVFTPNRLGRLNDLIKILGAHQLHVLALTVLDTTDSSIIRLVLDDPDTAATCCIRKVLRLRKAPSWLPK